MTNHMGCAALAATMLNSCKLDYLFGTQLGNSEYSPVISPKINARDPKPPCDGTMCNPQETIEPSWR
jgi:hypothetical protein